jgi:hypothetical protein
MNVSGFYHTLVVGGERRKGTDMKDAWAPDVSFGRYLKE